MNDVNYELLKQQILASNSFDECPKPPMTDYPKGANYVFISYSHKDYKAVYCDLLEFHKAGVRFWYDYGLPAGKDWNKVVEQKIKAKECSGVIFYLSSNLFLSRSVLREVEFTLGSDSGSGSSNKDYFCINLAGVQPSVILFQIIQNHSIDELKSLGVDTNQIGKLSSAFTDEATYIPKQNAGSDNHIKSSLEQISSQFNAIGNDFGGFTSNPGNSWQQGNGWQQGNSWQQGHQGFGNNGYGNQGYGDQSYKPNGTSNQAGNQSFSSDSAFKTKAVEKFKDMIPSERTKDIYAGIDKIPPERQSLFLMINLKNPTTAFILTLLLGFFGIGHFYIGNSKLGKIRIIMFVICQIAAVIPVLGVLVAIFFILCVIKDILTASKAAKESNYHTLMKFINN